MSRQQHGRARRGVLLLVVLGLLAMFGMVAITFVIITGRARQSAETARRVDEYYLPPREIANHAVMEILRGSKNQFSALWFDSLLEDKYGSGTLEAAMRHDNSAFYVTPVAGGQLIGFTPDPGVFGPGRELARRRVGCVLTMLDGPAQGRSTRIVGYVADDPATNQTEEQFLIQAFGDVDLTLFAQDIANRTAQGNPRRFIVNGLDFSGLGVGYDVNNFGTSHLLDATDLASREFALLPNSTEQEFRTFVANGPDGVLGTADDGRALSNENYDAPDFQNLPLSTPPVDTDGNGFLDTVIIPSYHRPALINYWRKRSVGAAGTWDQMPPELLYKTMLRPAIPYHFLDQNNNKQWDPGEPDFTGKVFDPIYGPWDVDNDGDGIADSVWLDIGLPVQSTADGRIYKPLVAVLCADLDGRLNLNAHGMLPQAADPSAAPYYAAPNTSTDLAGAVANRQFASPPPAMSQNGLMLAKLRGLGYGPAEVNLLPLFEYPTNSGNYQYAGLYASLLGGTVLPSGNPLDGRYGESQLLLASQTPRAGLTNVVDPLMRNKFYYYFDYCTSSYANFNLLTEYGSPPDMAGWLSVGLGLAGEPLYTMAGAAWPAMAMDLPYELNLDRDAARGLAGSAPLDNPFAVEEIETIFRDFDDPTYTPESRLEEVTFDWPNYFAALPPHRNDITTDSWHVPIPSSSLPLDHQPANSAQPATPGYVGRHPTDLIHAHNNTLDVDEMIQLLPPEVMAGLPMDLNRRLGNGRDDTGDGVVDDPREADVTVGIEQLNLLSAGGPIAVPMDHDNDGIPAATTDPRQLYARHLYVLMMATADLSFLEQPSQLGSRDAAARLIAQWAVNAVDFRDRDVIMTRFIYDPEPFDNNGWDPDGSDEVWGCERPELLFTEALATHDRRTQDLDADGGKYHDGDPSNGHDDQHDNFDQQFRPQGSLFFELYNPWVNQLATSRLDPPPRDLADPASGGVYLNRYVNAGGGAQNSAVWRVIVVAGDDLDPNNEVKDPDDPDSTKRPDILRAIYFVGPGKVSNLPSDGDVQFFPNDQQDAAIDPILPGRYGVVGPAEKDHTGESKTYLAFEVAGGADPQNPGNSRHILLDPGAADPVQVVGNDNGPPAGVQPAVAVLIGQPRRLSVTEPPTQDYPIPGGAALFYDQVSGGMTYTTAANEPQDKTAPASNNLWDVLKNDGTAEGYVVLYLQRLANPTVAYNATTNPYRTVDSIPVDLTVFNGVTTAALPQGQNAEPIKFETCQRGETNAPPGTFNLWKQEEQITELQPNWASGGNGLGTLVGTVGTQHYMDAVLRHSLGHLNDEFFGPVRTGPGIYAGGPGEPFPWLTWLDRPYANEMELLYVPTTSSSRLLVHDPDEPRENYAFVDGAAAPAPYGPSGLQQVPYPHLLNLFYSAPYDNPPVVPPNHKSPQFHRILEYVHVPSRYVGTETQMNPMTAVGNPNHRFHPPFHLISRYREPGRINLNTVFSPTVWRGLLNLPDLSEGPYAGANPTVWELFLESRRGYTVTPPSRFNADYPTLFARPFRSATSAHLVPIQTLKNAVGREVNATLLRQSPVNPNAGLFEVPGVADKQVNSDRNPFFRYRMIQRLANSVTTRSNVYAVWVTVGYFEVRQPPPNPTIANPAAIYPDGYQLQRELGSDTGDIHRHRAFYIIDRSIPVGFQRGSDLNVDKAILLSRFIE